MQQFRRLSEQFLARDAAVVTVFGFGVMIAFSFEPPAALVGAGAVALIFCIALIVRACLLTEDHVSEIEAWRHLDPEERPIGDDGLRWARDHFQGVLLHCAKSASTVAIGCFGAALVLEIVG
jgi:hypothetical protein